MRSFDTLSQAGQIRRLKRLAQAALEAYELGEARVIPVQHVENTTFRVETPGGDRYLLRIHRPGHRTPEELRSEAQWLAALRRDTDLLVPDPVLTCDGSLLTFAADPGVPEPRSCVLFRWLAGRFLDDGLTPRHMERVGALIARLHQHAASFVPPAGFTRGRVDNLIQAAWRLAEGAPPGLVAAAHDENLTDTAIEHAAHAITAVCSPEEGAIVAAAMRKARAELQSLGRGPETFGLIHADLHQANYLFQRGTVGAIDFDDCGYGYFLYDLAVTLRDVGHRKDEPALRAALLAGYRRVRPLPAAHESYLESLFALRRLQLMMWWLELRDDPAFANWRTWTARALRLLQTFAEA